MGRKVVGFHSEDELDGEEIGKVFVYDDDDPDNLLEEMEWMKISDARKLAEERGYDFEEEF
jgi:hypothetical protein